MNRERTHLPKHVGLLIFRTIGKLAGLRASIESRGLGKLVETASDVRDHAAFREHGFAAMGITEEYVSGE